VLRIVKPDERREEAQYDEIPVAAPAPMQPTPAPSAEALAFNKAVEGTDGKIPIHAAYLVCVGCRVADEALAFHHQAISHAPPGTFRRDVTPGLKSTQATRAWLETHLDELKKKSEQPDAATAPYERGGDLKEAVIVAGSEIDRGLAAAKTAQLKFEERAANRFKDVAQIVARAADLPKPVAKASASSTTVAAGSMYLLGTDVLGSAP
jgi:hypothetical protein